MRSKTVPTASRVRSIYGPMDVVVSVTNTNPALNAGAVSVGLSEPPEPEPVVKIADFPEPAPCPVTPRAPCWRSSCRPSGTEAICSKRPRSLPTKMSSWRLMGTR